MLDRDNSTPVEHLPHHYKVEGLSPAATINRREKEEKKDGTKLMCLSLLGGYILV